MMKVNDHPRSLRIMAALALTLASALMLAVAAPTHALAAESVAHTYDAKGNRVEYENIYDAVTAGYGNGTVYLDKDIEISNVIDVAAGKALKLDMQGHAIKVTEYNVWIFDIHENAKLTLSGSEDRTFSYKGFDKSDTTSDMQVTSGGLITGGSNVGSAGAINMRDGSTLTLDHVAVAGNMAANGSGTHDGGGGIYVGENCRLYLENKAIVTANYTNMNGGGIFMGGKNARVELDDSSVAHNFSKLSGGGIYAVNTEAHITLRNYSHIDDNQSFSCGGGVHFFASAFELSCNDATSTISNNYAVEGGGVNTNGSPLATNKGLIEGLEISNNSTYIDGGGLCISQENITIKDCVISGNKVGYGEGGGLYVDNDDILLDGCTITDNVAQTEGGGVYVPYKYDLKVAGELIVKDNARADGAVDDVFLDSTSANDGWAYLCGNVSEGSSVGIRTGVTGDRRIMKELTNYIEGTFFMDMDSYHLSYGSSDNDLWQRKGAFDYLVTLNGKNVRRFSRGDKVIVNGASDESGTFFWHWDASQSTGLPGGISDEDLYSTTLGFTMPQNDVHLVGVYAEPLTQASATIIGTVEAGETLPALAACSYQTSEGTKPYNARVTWYEVKEDGSKVAASGVAKPNTSYVASFQITRDATKARVFSADFADDGVTVKLAKATDTTTSASTTVDGATGALTVTTKSFTTGDGAAPEKTGTITINLKDAGLGGGEQAISLAAEGSDEDDDVFGSVVVSYAAGSDSVTINAPQAEGMNFCNWERISEAWCDYDDVSGTVVVKDLAQVSELSAVYTPVVTKAEVGLDAPAANQALPTQVTSIVAGCSDGSEVDLMKFFSEDGTLPVTWSPAAEDGKAATSTAYTALIELGDGDDLVDVESVIAPGAAVTANGTKATSAGFAVLDGKLYLCVAFPETEGAKLAGVTQPEDVELAFDEARACDQEQAEAAAGELCWPLPKSCGITLVGGQTIACDVAWDAPAGFDANATSAQQIVATGRLVLPSYVDANGVSLDVTCTLRIAAPDGGGDDKGDDDDKGKSDPQPSDEDEDKGGDTERKALPQTGDTNSTATVLVLVAAGAAALLVALILRRRK